MSRTRGGQCCWPRDASARQPVPRGGGEGGGEREESKSLVHDTGGPPRVSSGLTMTVAELADQLRDDANILVKFIRQKTTRTRMAQDDEDVTQGDEGDSQDEEDFVNDEKDFVKSRMIPKIEHAAQDDEDVREEFDRCHEVVEMLLFRVSMNPRKWGNAAEDCVIHGKSSQRYKLVRSFLHYVVTLHDTFQNTSYLTQWIAELIYRAPIVAGVFLDMLFVESCHARSCYVQLHGWLFHHPMVTQYGEDRNISRSGGDTDNEDVGFALIRADNCVIAMQKKIAPHVYKVAREKCVLPNIMDLDIIQALAYTENRDVSIFAKRSVQALLYCGMDHLLVPWDIVRVCLGVLELIALVSWGLTSHGGDAFDRLRTDWKVDSKDELWLIDNGLKGDAWDTGSRWTNVYAYNNSADKPWAWNIIAAAALRRIIDRAWLVRAFLRRRREASGKLYKGPGYLTNIWELKALAACNAEDFAFWALFVKVLFLCSTSVLTPGRNVMSSAQEALLSITILLEALNTMMVTVQSTGGTCALHLSAVTRAILSNEVFYFSLLGILVFIAFFVSWVVVEREKPTYLVIIHLFRGLMLGDGSGLDYLKVANAKDQQAGTFQGLMGAAFVILFLLVFSNLLIAVFSNSYDSARKKAWLYFHRTRARNLRTAILGTHKFPRNGTMSIALEKCGWESLLSRRGTFVLSSGLLLLLLGLAMQAVAHWCTTAGNVGIASIVVGSILLEAYPFISVMTPDMKHDWYPRELKSGEKPCRHILKLRCRADYDENFFLGS